MQCINYSFAMVFEAKKFVDIEGIKASALRDLGEVLNLSYVVLLMYNF